MPIDVHVLGALRVQVDGVDAALGGPMPRALLSRLLIAGGDTVPASALIDELWRGAPPRSASGTLQGYVSTLRRGIEPAHGRETPTVLVRTGAGYALHLPDDALDADRFVAQARRGHTELAARRPEQARDLFAGALAMWTGRAYADAEGWEFAEVEADRLESLRADAVDGHLAAMSACGDQELVIAELTKLLRTNPLREKWWELLALAQYRAGHQAEALESLRRARRVVADELGTDPGPSLVALHTAILRQDPSLLPTRPISAGTDSAAAGAGAAHPGADGPAADHVRIDRGTPRRHIPTALTSFVGRDAEVAEVTAMLRTERLVTVTGPGGIGKTRVALAVAQGRAADGGETDGPWFLEFSGAHDHDAVVDTLVRVLRLTAPGGLDTVASLLAERETLLVFDNCEHIADEIAKAALGLLTACPRLSILATSRVRLGVPGESVYVLAPLADGASLFAERAPAAAGFENRGDIIALCDALDNLPLAIELAAARNSVLSVRQLRERLDDRFAMLRHDRRGAPGAGGDRHISMEAAIDASYRALDDSQRTLFDALSVFEGSFDFTAAEAVTGHGVRLLPDLEALIDSSMVTVIGGDPRRYRILETLRQYAREHLAADVAAAIDTAHLEWVREFSRPVFAGLQGPDSLGWTRRIDVEMPNIHAALVRSRTDDPVAYLEIVGNIVWYWYRRGLIDEGVRMLDPVVAAAGDPAVPIAVRLRALTGAMMIAYLCGDLASLLSTMGVVDGLIADGDLGLETREDRFVFADATLTLGNFQAGAGLVEEGSARARVALEIAASDDQGWLETAARMVLGAAAFRAGDHETAGVEFTRSVEIGRERGHDWVVGSSLWIHAKCDIAGGRIDGPAQRKLAGLVDITRSTDDLTSWMTAIDTLACVAFRRGDHATAARLLGVVARHTERTGYRPDAMDIVDLGPWVAQIRDEVDDDVFAEHHAIGRALTDAEADDFVAACLS
ncbi:BTAD domain-containing putative transcriptional regulator [Gordonia sp. NB41Y]|uniref:AfsR/SARP family transcriptional regulator n=1 Tax=Gordonia sp. NB41Y TaxID=875808 RepID=UPI00273C8BF2|nr:BTAD domain-containing putative transcriptional regulator [Gordonia sp. NB41Y]WLP90936.1 BTAD domain-containing putative transcriptional regulator [Gordonia sp. NB41Y]